MVVEQHLGLGEGSRRFTPLEKRSPSLHAREANDERNHFTPIFPSWFIDWPLNSTEHFFLHRPNRAGMGR